jgi:hypothetical protein
MERSFVKMGVRIPGKGEFFSRGLDRAITGHHELDDRKPRPAAD